MVEIKDISEIKKLLKLRQTPVAMRLEEAPSVEEAFSGHAPASCSFWKLGIDCSFHTVYQDHNCSIGRITHGYSDVDQVKDNDDIKLLTSINWITIDELSKLPRLPKSKIITYIPVDQLRENGNKIDILTFFCNAEQAMLVATACEKAGVNYKVRTRPTCAILADAYNLKAVVIGLGCTVSRIRTPYSVDDLFIAMHSSVIQKILPELRTAVKADEQIYAIKEKLV